MPDARMNIQRSLVCQFHVLLLVLLTVSSALAADKAELRRHTVVADGHPIALWEKSAAGASEAILLVHGRTWSALPDFDLQVEGEDLSLMDGLVAEGYAVYAVDLRGYGATPRDATDWLTPNRAADDVAIVIEWIADANDRAIKPHLFGWSMGSTISQLMVQRHPDMVASLTLFGYWRDDDVELPGDEPGIKPAKEKNTAEAAASDFITPGSISQKAIDAYVAQSLEADPVRVDLKVTFNTTHWMEHRFTCQPWLLLASTIHWRRPRIRQNYLRGSRQGINSG